MMATVVTLSSGVQSETFHLEEKKKLIADLVEAVKQCQLRFGGRTELATESDQHIAVLCCCLEAALCHGLRPKPLNKSISTLKQVTDAVSSSLNLNRSEVNNHVSFWQYISHHLTRHEYERYLLLKQVCTDTGRGRAWLRSSLNEHSLERYLQSLLSNPQQMSVYYEDWALLLDEEQSSQLPALARGLKSILFAISIDKEEFNLQRSLGQRTIEPLIGCSTLSHSQSSIISSSSLPGLENDSGSRRKVETRRKKKGVPQIISFDDDVLPQSSPKTREAGGKFLESSSAPSTCLNSPISITVTPTKNYGPAEDSQSSSSGSNVSGANTTTTAAAASSNFDGNNSSSSTDKTTPQSQNDTSLNSESSPLPAKDHGSGSPQLQTATALQAQTSHSDFKRESRSVTSMLTKQLQTLTPVNNLSVGELIPVSLNEEAQSEDDSLSVPSYSEYTDCAAAALLATQKLLQNSTLEYIPPEQPSGSARTKSKVELPPHVNGEVRDALLAIITQKQELQKENHTLRKSLEEQEEKINTLQAEMAESSRSHADKVEKIESRLQSLNRENELLKHQLRKYVGAVQMLKRDGIQAHEMLSQLAGGNIVGETVDYHNEAREYEKKLIQVAEMHGELMEFNDRLHRILQTKEVALRRLRDELIDLRGPLPEETGTSDDDANSVTSDYEGGSINTAVRALVNIWVPSAFLTGGSSDVHHVYQVFIRIRDDEWNIYRRYAQFYSLHKDLKKRDAVVGTFDFPPKKALGNKDARFVEERRRRLQHYLRCVMNHLVQTSAELATAPGKDLLVHLVPFFGEFCNAGDQRNRRKRASSRNPFTRLTRVNPENSVAHSSPQYTGL